jgi:hypothetical protein
MEGVPFTGLIIKKELDENGRIVMQAGYIWNCMQTMGVKRYEKTEAY